MIWTAWLKISPGHSWKGPMISAVRLVFRSIVRIVGLNLTTVILPGYSTPNLLVLSLQDRNNSRWTRPSAHVIRTNWKLLPWPKKKEPSLWCIMWYRRICSLISLRCIDAWSHGSRKSRSLAVLQLNQAPWFLDITRFWFYASAAWFFFFVQGSTTSCCPIMLLGWYAVPLWARAILHSADWSWLFSSSKANISESPSFFPVAHSRKTKGRISI